MNREDNKNLILAILLSVLVFVGWTYFYGAPQMERQRQEAEMAQSQQEEAQTQQQNIPAPGEAQVPQPEGSAEPAAPTGALPGVAVEQTREAALGANPRVTIDTVSKRGSLNLRGARIDDIVLKDYQESVEEDSDNIVLFSPTGTADPYYAEFGWVGTVPGGLPDSQTLWQSDRDELTPGAPVTLTWENDAGIVFRRSIAIDDNAMFTIEDSVENVVDEAVTVFPYGLISRHGEPETIGFFILHEGLVGVLGEEGLQEYSYSNVLDESRITTTVRGTTWADNIGGWLGITDKYWAATIIPDQATPFQGRFTVEEGGARPIFQTDVLGEGIVVQPGETGVVTTRLFAGAKEVDVIDGYRDNYGISRFDLFDRLGLVSTSSPSRCSTALDFFNGLLGNFGVAILVVTGLSEDLLLAARQQVIRLDGEDEGRAAGDDGDPRSLQGRSHEAAAGTDGPVQAREDQSGCRLLACADPDSRLLRALQGAFSSRSRCATPRSLAGSRIWPHRIRHRSSTCSACCPSPFRPS